MVADKSILNLVESGPTKSLSIHPISTFPLDAFAAWETSQCWNDKCFITGRYFLGDCGKLNPVSKNKIAVNLYLEHSSFGTWQVCMCFQQYCDIFRMF